MVDSSNAAAAAASNAVQGGVVVSRGVDPLLLPTPSSTPPPHGHCCTPAHTHTHTHTTGLVSALQDITQELHSAQGQLQYWKVEADAWKTRCAAVAVLGGWARGNGAEHTSPLAWACRGGAAVCTAHTNQAACASRPDTCACVPTGSQPPTQV